MKRVVSIFAFFFVMAFASGAYAIHKGAGDLVCGGCHTMHNSQGGGDLNGTGMADSTSLVLLRGDVQSRAEIHKFCLQCHGSNGAQATIGQPPHGQQAPKVYNSIDAWNWTVPFNQIGSGGDFSTELSANWDATTPDRLGFGHSVGITAANAITPPGGDQSIGDFSCTSCHDPHGTDDPLDPNINKFRNLRVNAINAGLNSGAKFPNEPARPYREHNSYVGGVTGRYGQGGANYTPETTGGGVSIWPVYRGSLTGDPNVDSGNTNVYATGWDGDGGVTMSRWCAQCHDNWHEAIVGPSQGPIWTPAAGFSQGIGPDWKRHPVNGMMPRASTAGCAAGCHTSLLDRVNYNLNVIMEGKGLPVTTSNYFSGYVYYLPTDTTGASPSGMDTPALGDNHKVFCLTCHFAHGGPYYDNLRWPYLSAVDAGSQTPNGVPTNMGCQLCHNR